MIELGLTTFVLKCLNTLYANLREQNSFKLYFGGFLFAFGLGSAFETGIHISQAGFKFTK